MSRQSIVSFFFSLLYTLLVVSKSSGCSWCPAHIPVAFVISARWPGFPLPATEGSLWPLSPPVPCEQPSSDTAGRWINIAAPSPPEWENRPALDAAPRCPPAGLSPAACRVALYGLPSLPCSLSLSPPSPSWGSPLKETMSIVIN